ncbi:hypothetical protein V9K67_06150 [Paraflavisolibacter sp. H34]|uniref:hypothetical protein n=1 Tax=Huijunlia imazamoxiresistens TaxID=3127457 RepID=UPI00301844CC
MNKALGILPLIVLSLLAAIWTGWLRLGWSLPLPNAVAQHGALMVNSFLATLVFLERAVTVKSRWLLLLPAVNGISVLFFLGHQPAVAQGLLIAGSGGFLLLCGYFAGRYKELYYYVFLAGAFCLLSGNIILFHTHFYPYAVSWWMAFLLLTIVAERLELSRFLALNNAQRAWLLAALGGLLLSLFVPFHLNGSLYFSVALVAVAAWLLRYDMARRSVRMAGQHRYSGALLLVGYAWLPVTALLLTAGRQTAFGYDAALHAFFIGFVFSMIFSHAPIILPAVLRLPVKLYRPVLYLWFALLQLTLVARMAADWAGACEVRRWAGLLNGVVILLFFTTVALTLRRELSRRKMSPRANLHPVLQ